MTKVVLQASGDRAVLTSISFSILSDANIRSVEALQEC